MNKIYKITALLLTVYTLQAQEVPNAINYQAIARDAMGSPIPNASISAEISILQGSAGGQVIYSERHTSTTNDFGLYQFTIGEGATSDNLSSIDWSSSEYFIETSISIDGSGDLVSTAKINSVPYSMLAYRSVIDEVDDADNDMTNELQDLELTGTTLSISDGNSVNLSSLAGGGGGSDDQVLSASLNGTDLTISLEDGGSQTIDLSSLSGSSTDDQKITASLNGTDLIITLEDGGSERIDLSSLGGNGGSDDQQISDFSLNGTEITLSLEDGGTATLDLSSAIPPGGSDDQIITDFTLNGSDLTIALEDGGDQTVDLSSLQGGSASDDQQLESVTLDGNDLTIVLEDGGMQTVDLSSLSGGTGGTDDQQISDFSLNGTELTMSLEDGGSASVDLASILPPGGTDDQEITDFSLNGTELTLTLEDGGTAMVDIGSSSGLPGPQGIQGEPGPAGPEGQAGMDGAMGPAGSEGPEGPQGPPGPEGPRGMDGGDDQQIEDFTLNGTDLIITLEDGGTRTVDLSGLQSTGGSDNQMITASLNGTDLIINLENGGTETIDLSSLSSSSDQIWQRRASSNDDIFFNGRTVEVEGNLFSLVNDNDVAIVNTFQGATTKGGTTSYDTEDGEPIAYIGAVRNTPGQGLIQVYDEGETRIRLEVDGTSAGRIVVEDEFNEIASIESNLGRGNVNLNDEFGNRRIFITTDNTGQGVLTYGNNGDLASRFGNLLGFPDHGLLSVQSDNVSRGLLLADEFGNGSLQLADAFGNLNVQAYANGPFGSFIAVNGVKYFKMDHPEMKNKEIWYACVEGPEAAAYDRGTANLKGGEIFVPFSDHFHHVINPETMTVHLTPNSTNTYGLAVVEKTEKGFRVKELMGGQSDFSFDWEVKAVRKGFEDLKVIRDKKTSTVLGAPVAPTQNTSSSKILTDYPNNNDENDE